MVKRSLAAKHFPLKPLIWTWLQEIGKKYINHKQQVTLKPSPLIYI